ncbi:MAG: iron-sulfur cluster repair di-iron protein [Lutibacter sp.]|nr:iron-sulfur cluster repair di-iron protein [bacterium AH-315-A23]PHQ56828.1 MAG: iron-sulfur cluster repair di-iron protein [Lutibacter sp.]
MLDLKNKTIAEIVSDDISKASIFKKYNLDFCCGGGKTVENACIKANINVDDVVNDLINSTSKTNAPNLNFKDWTPEFLVDYITNIHHSYVKENLGIIHEFATKVASVHGEHAKETIEISNLFSTLSDELTSHLEKEETILFPAIRAKAADSNFQYDKNVISILEDEHDNAGTIVKKIQSLSNNFTPPEWACNTYKALYHKLDEFINDLYQHIHLENNILFPKVKE